MMGYRYSSPREALRNYFAERGRGPKPARQFWGERSDSRNYKPSDRLDWLDVGRLLHGETSLGGCGIGMGSKEEEAVRKWANETGEQSWVTLKVERTLRSGLRKMGLMPPRQRVNRDQSGGARLVETEDGNE